LGPPPYIRNPTIRWPGPKDPKRTQFPGREWFGRCPLRGSHTSAGRGEKVPNIVQHWGEKKHGRLHLSHQIKYVKSSKHSNALDESSYLVINGDSAESGHSVMKLATFQERFGIQAVIFSTWLKWFESDVTAQNHETYWNSYEWPKSRYRYNPGIHETATGREDIRNSEPPWMDRYWWSMLILIYLNYGTSKLIKGISLQKYEQKKEHVRLRMIEGNQSIKQYIKHRFWKRCHFEVVDFPSAGGWRWCSSQGDQQLMSMLAWPWGDSFLYQNMVINAYIYIYDYNYNIYIYIMGEMYEDVLDLNDDIW